MSVSEAKQPKEIWDILLADRLQKLRTEDRDRLRGLLNYDTFQQALPILLAKHNGRSSTQLLKVIRPVIEWLKTFSSAVTSMSQADPFGSLGWGVAQLLLEVITLRCFFFLALSPLPCG